MANRVFVVNACQEMGENFVSSPYVQIIYESYHGTVTFSLSSEQAYLLVEDLLIAANKAAALDRTEGFAGDFLEGVG